MLELGPLPSAVALVSKRSVASQDGGQSQFSAKADNLDAGVQKIKHVEVQPQLIESSHHHAHLETVCWSVDLKLIGSQVRLQLVCSSVCPAIYYQP